MIHPNSIKWHNLSPTDIHSISLHNHLLNQAFPTRPSQTPSMLPVVTHFMLAQPSVPWEQTPVSQKQTQCLQLQMLRKYKFIEWRTLINSDFILLAALYFPLYYHFWFERVGWDGMEGGRKRRRGRREVFTFLLINFLENNPLLQQSFKPKHNSLKCQCIF